MISFYRKTCKVSFTAACVIVVAVMVSYWLYKFKVEDRDIGVVDYVPLKDAKEIKFPVVSICLENPFIDEKLKEKNSSITSMAYRQYLEGKIYDKSYEQIDYPNVTIDLNQYLLAGNVWWRNETMVQIDLDNFNLIETFSGFYGTFNTDAFIKSYTFFKCYSMKFVVDGHRNVKKVGAIFNWTRLNSDWQSNQSVVHFIFHYPSQFFVLRDSKIQKSYLNHGGKTEFNFKNIEILKQRKTRNRKCSKDVENYDDTVVDEVLHKTGCRPPYIQSHKFYPQCEVQEDIFRSKIDTLANERVGIPKPCERASEIRKNVKHSDPPTLSKTWLFMINYPEEVKTITQSQDVDVHSLIGNIGGYLGLFLGKPIFYSSCDLMMLNSNEILNTIWKKDIFFLFRLRTCSDPRSDISHTGHN